MIWTGHKCSRTENACEAEGPKVSKTYLQVYRYETETLTLDPTQL